MGYIKAQQIMYTLLRLELPNSYPDTGKAPTKLVKQNHSTTVYQDHQGAMHRGNVFP